jgi:hypothetical protein
MWLWKSKKPLVRGPQHVLDVRGVQPVAAAPQPKRRRAMGRRGWIGVAVVSGVLVVGGVIFGSRLFSRADDAAIETVLTRLGRHYLLPTNEEPAVATVTDKTKLTTPFLKSAENGDKVIIYEKNKIAFIYRPSRDRIVAVGPVMIDKPPTPDKK